MSGIINNNNLGVQATAPAIPVATQRVSSMLALITTTMNKKSEAIDGDKFVADAEKALQVMQGTSPQGMVDWVVNMKVLGLSNGQAILDRGLNQTPDDATNAKPNLTKKRQIAEFIVNTESFKAAVLQTGGDMRCVAATTILRTPTISAMLRDVYNRNVNKLIFDAGPVVLSKAIVSCLKVDEYLTLSIGRMRGFIGCLRALEENEKETRTKGVHGGRYFGGRHWAPTEAGRKLVIESNREQNTTIDNDTAKTWAAGNAKAQIRANFASFLIGCPIMSPALATQCGDFKQSRNTPIGATMLLNIGRAMNLLVYVAGGEEQAEFEVGNAKSASMVVYFTCMSMLKDTRRAFLAPITTAGGPNSRAGTKAAGKLAENQKTFKMF